jgi:hypothetical protein
MVSTYCVVWEKRIHCNYFLQFIAFHTLIIGPTVQNSKYNFIDGQITKGNYFLHGITVHGILIKKLYILQMS